MLEDSKRHKSDSTENNRKVLIGNSQTKMFEEKKWRQLKVGQIVKVHENQFFPADMILLSSSASKGICYIETKNLDGETNLKHKQSHSEISSYYPNEAELLQM